MIDTTELDRAEDAALVALNTIREVLKSPVPDLRGTCEAQQLLNRYIRLRNQQNAAEFASLRAAGVIKRADRKSVV